MYRVFIVQAYQTIQYVVPSGGIFLGKWRSSFVGYSDGKINVQSACALNNRYIILNEIKDGTKIIQLITNIKSNIRQENEIYQFLNFR
jgi:hypothetical protein